MNLLQGLLTFLAHRWPQQSASPPTQEAHPQQAAPLTSIFHGVGTLTIFGGTFIVIGKCTVYIFAGNRINQQYRLPT